MSIVVDSILDNYISIVANIPGLSNSIAKLKALNYDVKVHSLIQAPPHGKHCRKDSVHEMLFLTVSKTCTTDGLRCQQQPLTSNAS